MRIVVSFSGGKDSQACLIWAVNKYGKDNVEALFFDTGWEHIETYNHIKEVTSQMGVKLICVSGEKTFIDLAISKGVFPRTMSRFCTEELKIKPAIDWVLKQCDNLLIIQGIRSGESRARREMDAECMYFRNYYEKLPNGKTYSYRKKEVFEWCKKYDASILRPIKEWTSQQVIDCILSAGQKPNPLYYKGFSRVGCFPCIMCNQNEIRLIANNHKEILKKIDEAEKLVGSSFFYAGFIPNKYCATKNKPSVYEVANYVSRNYQEEKLFEQDYSCMSLFHGLCE